MDAFGDNFDQAEVDPAAEFLAREKDQLAGLEDELEVGGAPQIQVNQQGIHMCFSLFSVFLGVIFPNDNS